jgi:opacity protein-like surface antigen
MTRLKIVSASAALILSGSAALAADASFPTMPPPMPAEIVPVSFASGWYIRGDVGYRFGQVGQAVDVAVTYPETSITEAYVAGGGAGYKWQWLRLDLTGDYGGRTTLSGSNAAGGQSFEANVETYSVMLNAYADLGTWWGFTPYIGGGVGKARIATSQFETSPPRRNPLAPAHRWNNAWAAMAGFTYNITDNLLVDVGYRHIDMGAMGGGLDVNQTFIDRLTADEIRVGLRYNID